MSSRSSRALLEIQGLTAPQIGEAAATHGFVLHELTPLQASLEEAFMEMTRDDVEFRTGDPADANRPVGGGSGMSAVAQAAGLPRLATTGRVTQLNVMRSEWTKLISLRSTRWSLGGCGHS